MKFVERYDGFIQADHKTLYKKVTPIYIEDVPYYFYNKEELYKYPLSHERRCIRVKELELFLPRYSLASLVQYKEDDKTFLIESKNEQYIWKEEDKNFQPIKFNLKKIKHYFDSNFVPCTTAESFWNTANSRYNYLSLGAGMTFILKNTLYEAGGYWKRFDPNFDYSTIKYKLKIRGPNNITVYESENYNWDQVTAAFAKLFGLNKVYNG